MFPRHIKLIRDEFLYGSLYDLEEIYGPGILNFAGITRRRLRMLERSRRVTPLFRDARGRIVVNRSEFLRFLNEYEAYLEQRLFYHEAEAA